MTTPQHIADAITRLVKPQGTYSCARETIEAHACKICHDHNRILVEMIYYLETGDVRSRQIKDWASETKRDDPLEVAMMKGVLEGAMVKLPSFEGLSDERALEVYGRLLLNLYNLEVAGQPPLA
jgi:hypothetical protein